MFRPLLCLLLAITSAAAAPPPPATGLEKPLFDGQTLAGWEAISPQLWKVSEGCITGGNGEKVAHNDFLCSTAQYENFVLRLRIKLTGDPALGMINSGIQIRTQRQAKGFEVSGFQCDYGEPSWYGALYDEGRRNKLLAPSDMAALNPVLKRNDWNEYVIRADGPRIQTWINGVQGVDYTEADETIPGTGRLGIQIHAGGNGVVQVKEIVLEELPPSPVTPKVTAAPAPAAPAHASPLTPEEERATFSLPPGFVIELVAAESEGIGKFVTVDWDQRGRMWSQTALEYPVDGNESAARAQALYAGPGRDKVLVFDVTTGPGPHAPRVFAEGLAIPLGILPQGKGVYVQHGPNIEFLEDRDGDGKADQTRVLLTGFGVQDSHLFMHQFTRMPGGWIWGAQGAFNSGKVKTTGGEVAPLPFDSTRMARFRPDGSRFEPLCTGPCNIWGFVVRPDGDAFIQEANDYGYPVMPFAIGGNYPGCADRFFKSYGPEFPGTAPDFRMGGTGLSGLAFSDEAGTFPAPYAGLMYVANPITQKVQPLRMVPDGPRWNLRLLPDFLTSSDPMFRPVAIHFGPDGALYIVDWYNKVISHNEVPRNHPDRDKLRGRIWRVRHQDQVLAAMPDLTTCPPAELLRVLGGANARQSHLAWQAIVDRAVEELAAPLTTLAGNPGPVGARVRALWALEGLSGPGKDRTRTDLLLRSLLHEQDRHLRLAAVEMMSRLEGDFHGLLEAVQPLAQDPDPGVRAAVIRALSGFEAGQAREAIGVGRGLAPGPGGERALAVLVGMAGPALPGPVAPSTRNRKLQPVREAYDRAFERYLVREALEQSPARVEAFLASTAAESLPVENRLLATLALEPRASAARLAALLPQAGRAPNDEELLRLAQFPGEPGVAQAFLALLQNPVTRTGALEGLLRVRNRVNAAALTPLLQNAAEPMLAGDAASLALGLQLIESFELRGLEPALVALTRGHGALKSAQLVACLQTLGRLHSAAAPLFLEIWLTAGDPAIRQAALEALAQSAAPEAPGHIFELWSGLTPAQRRLAVDRLSTSPAGARAVVEAIGRKTVDPAELEGAVAERLTTLLGREPALAPILEGLGNVFRPVLRLPGGNDSYAETGLSLEGPFTVETWVRLDPGIGNEDGILGAPGQLDLNFFDGRFRVWAGPQMRDALIAQKKIVAENWTHVAVTRNAQGGLRIFLDGEPDPAKGKPAPQKFENVRIGWTQVAKGTAGQLAEFRIWNRERSDSEVRNGFDRAVDDAQPPAGLVFHARGEGPWGKLHGQARVVKVSDAPPLLSAEEARVLDGKFAKYRALAETAGGDPGRGREVAALCRACHLIQGEGGSLAPNISGAGTMGLEALLRNIITPNAAMEAGYRTYRVELKSGELVEGFFVTEDAEALVVRAPGAADRRLPKSEVQRAQYLRRSLMPEGLLDALTSTQVSDLFAYLLSLKG